MIYTRPNITCFFQPGKIITTEVSKFNPAFPWQQKQEKSPCPDLLSQTFADRFVTSQPTYPLMYTPPPVIRPYDQGVLTIEHLFLKEGTLGDGGGLTSHQTDHLSPSCSQPKFPGLLLSIFHVHHPFLLSSVTWVTLGR